VNASRACLPGGIWSEVDFTTCTINQINVEPFILVWLNFASGEDGFPDPIPMQLQHDIIDQVHRKKFGAYCHINLSCGS